MPALPITPPSPARAGTALRGSPPTGSDGADTFAALLTQNSARTAAAEGPKTRPAQTRRRDHDAAPHEQDVAGDRDAPEVRAERADAASTRAEHRPDAAEGDGAADPQAQGQGRQAPDSGPQPETAVATATAQAALATASGAAPPTPAGASPVTVPVAPPAVPADPKGVPVDGTAAADPAGQLPIPSAVLDQSGTPAGGHGKAGKDGGPAQHELPAAPALSSTTETAVSPTATTTGAAAQTPPDAGAGQSTGQSAQPPPTAQSQPSATLLTAVPVAGGAPQLTRGAVVATAERVQELVHIATTRSGNARATLQLRPEALGRIDVHLRTTSNGLVATIAAHEHAGLQALQQAGAELRRTLEDKGVQLHSLDLQLGTGDNGASSQQRDAREASSGSRGASSSYGLEDDEDIVAQELTLTIPSPTAAGALVDVQA
jgi:hypothetical protein